MSNLVFPAVLQGMDIKVDRAPLDAVHVDEAESGKETRWTGSTYPRYRYDLDFNILRADSFLANAARNREWQQFCTHVARHFGKLDSFLWTDPDDSSVTDMGFAVGDGVTASFQLQRTLAGDLIDAAGVEYAAQTKPYTNLVKNSSFETDTNADGLADNWTEYNSTSTTEPTTRIIVTGLNGGKAQRVSWGTNTTGTKGVFQSGVSTPAFVIGQWYTISFFARASGSNVGKFVGLNWNTFPSQTIATACPALSTAWQRYVFQVLWTAAPIAEIYLTISNLNTGAWTATSTFGDLDFDLVQVVAGQHGVADFQPFETPAATTGTRTPAYWPAIGDGFEPIFERNGDVTFYEDGTWRGRRTLYPFTRTNLLPWSQALTNAAWTATNCTVTAAATTAPDGTATGFSMNEGVATGFHFIQQTVTDVQGELRCWSVFLKAGTLTTAQYVTSGAGVGINVDLSAGTVTSTIGAGLVASGVQSSPLWPGWFRFWFVERVGVTVDTSIQLLCAASSYTGTSRIMYAWGLQSERVSNLLGPTPYIQTPSSAAVTVTDYGISATGLFTPASVPAAGTFYSWDGAFYRRVRMDMDSVPTSRLAQYMYEAKRISLLSCKQ